MTSSPLLPNTLVSKDSVVGEVIEFLNSRELFNAFREEEVYPWHWRNLSAKKGYTLLDVSRDDGGLGLMAQDMAKLYEVCGRISINSRELLGCGHAGMIAKYGSPEQKRKYLSKIGSGNLLVGVGLTEPGVGSDLASIKSYADRVGDSYVLFAHKEWVSRIHEAKTFIVFAKTNRNMGAKGLTAFLVDMDNPCISTYEKRPMGLRGWSFGGFEIAGLELPYTSRLGDEGQGFEIFNNHFLYWRILMGMICIGAAKASIDETLEYISEREAFGSPIGRFQGIVHRMVESLTKIESARLLCLKACETIENGEPSTQLSAMSKWYATQISYEAIDACIQTMGARGYDSSCPLEQRLRDVRGLMIADGSNDTLKSLVGREILGRELYNAMLNRNSNSSN